MPTYAEDIAPVIETRCVSCHFGREGGPWPLTSYGHVADWADSLRTVMLACAMPPPPADMPTEERALILDWLRCGLPR